MTTVSALQQARSEYLPKLPPVLAENGPSVKLNEGAATEAVADQEAIRNRFPNTYGLPVVTFAPGESCSSDPVRVGVILSGGQAPGGHNVITGLFDALKAANSKSELYGFLGGPSGLIKNKYRHLTSEMIDQYRNTGGFDMICSGRTKLEKEEDFARASENCRELGISALVVIGGDDSNTNACVLAEYMVANNQNIQVLGCPKTIDGDLKNENVEISFGFNTATRVYSELIGNIQRDANSARKYWHFIRLMGRSASHITLECALQTQPNVALISEEVAEKEQTLNNIVRQLGETIVRRMDSGMNFGVVLVPEGLIEFIPEMRRLIADLNELLARNAGTLRRLSTTDEQLQFVNSRLSTESSQTFSSLPAAIQTQLMMDRDPHGNVQVSRIETEKLLISMLKELLLELDGDEEGRYSDKLRTQGHFFGYEGRCAPPTNFDADYCYTLGYSAAALAMAGKTGYMASVRNLASPGSEWVPGGVPLTMMMNMERRQGEDRPVIRKALVDLEGLPFKVFAGERDSWAQGAYYQYPGPVQYFGPASVCDPPPLTLVLEQKQD